MKIRIVKLLNLIRYRIIGTIFLAITITGNAIEATAPNIDYIFIIPILVMGTILLWPLIRGRRIVSRIYRKSMNKYKSRLKVCLFFILGFHNKLVGIPIKQKSMFGWVNLCISILGAVSILSWMYINNISIWIFIFTLVLSIYRVLKVIYS